MLTTVALGLLLTFAPEPPAYPKPPAVKFLSAAKDGVLVFELSNPNAQALPYIGYRPDSFEGGLKEGTIAPLYRVEVLRNKAWNAHKMGWCGTGLGKVSVAGKGKATFAVGLLGGDWDKFRVGVTWFKAADRKESAVAWSEALSKDNVALKKP
jgi:hypothetical protein